MATEIENTNSEMVDVDLDIDFGDETDIEAIKAKAKQAITEKVTPFKEKNSQLFARAKKAEGFNLVDGKWMKATQSTETKPEVKTTQHSSPAVTQDDLVLSRSNVHDEDFDVVKKFAQLEGVSVREALKSEDLKAVLERRAGVRKTAEVANTTTVRRTSTKVDDNALLAKLSKGEVPDKGSEEAERIFWARRGGKR